MSDCQRKHFDGPFQCPYCRQKLHKTGGVVTYTKTGKMKVSAGLTGCQLLHSDDHLKCECGYEVEVDLAWLASHICHGARM